MFDSRKIDDYFNGKRQLDEIRYNNKPQTSRWLRFVKLGFPCVAAAILGVMLVMPNIKKSIDLQNNVTMPRKNEMEKLHIEQTVYHTTDSKNRVGTVTADSVDEVAPGSKEVKINSPKGEIPTDNGMIKINAVEGYFNQEKNMLRLNGHVNAIDESGTVVRTEEVVYDFDAAHDFGLKERVLALAYCRIETFYIIEIRVKEQIQRHLVGDNLAEIVADHTAVNIITMFGI